MTRIAIKEIEVSGGTQSRGAILWPVVEEYADLYRADVKLPPVTVFFDGDAYWLADGFHRVNAAQSAEMEHIEADVRQGTKEDAVWFSCGANRGHGVRRTNTDKRRAVETALGHAKSKGLSDRAIAEHCGVHQSTVGEIRKSFQVSESDTSTSLRTGRDGKQQKPHSEKRKKAARASAAKRAQAKPPTQEREPTAAAGDAASALPSSPPADDANYDAVAALALKLVGLALALTVQQQDSIMRLIAVRIGSKTVASL